ncbi:MAG: hypothetical protein FLDDKLPJ_02000 [Phycisphaerae bacterium]|nr:hypothetical protein [Phycisphaerae bacterium]
MGALTIYVDTSVFGGCFDVQFEVASRELLSQAIAGRFLLKTSAVVLREIDLAPPRVRDLFAEHLPDMELLETDTKSLKLQEAYLTAGVVSRRSANDALHVALASVGRCDCIVSWNFRHIVHYDKVPLYQAVNTLNGLPKILILSPSEVIEYEEEGV